MKKSLQILLGSAGAVLLAQPAFASQLFNWELTCLSRQEHTVGSPGSFVSLGCPGSGKLTGTVSMPNSYTPGTTYAYSAASGDTPVITFFDTLHPFSLTLSGVTSFGSITLPASTGPASWVVSTPTGSSTTIGALTTFNSDLIAGATFFAAQGMDLTVSPIPEPATLLMLVGGLAGLGAYKKRQQRQDALTA